MRMLKKSKPGARYEKKLNFFFKELKKLTFEHISDTFSFYNVTITKVYKIVFS